MHINLLKIILKIIQLFFEQSERNGLLSCLYNIECANLKKV